MIRKKYSTGKESVAELARVPSSPRRKSGDFLYGHAIGNEAVSTDCNARLG